MWPCTHGCANARTHNPVNGEVHLVCVCMCVFACMVCDVHMCTYVCVCACMRGLCC